MKKIIVMLSIIALIVVFGGGVALGTDGSGAAPSGCTMEPTMIIMLVAMVGIFYFFMIRPENKKKKKLAEMRAAMTVGDTITTIGGIIGKIVSIDDEKVTFETSEDRVRVQVAKWAISTVGKQTEEPAK